MTDETTDDLPKLKFAGAPSMTWVCPFYEAPCSWVSLPHY